MAIKNIFLTGEPSSGKTSVIIKIIKKLPAKAVGFYTEEERIDGKRVGFMMHTLDGKTGYLAHENLESSVHLRRYGVSLENIENLAVPSIKPINHAIIILDEIGKMECFSKQFITAAKEALDSPNLVIGTITFGKEGFIHDVKMREDVEIIEVTKDNRDSLPSIILGKITQLMQ